MDKKELGGRLRQAREGTGYTQEDVAVKLHLTRPTITRYETGDNDPPSAVLASLAVLYGVTTDWLFGISRDDGGPTRSVAFLAPNRTAQVVNLPSDLHEIIRNEEATGWRYLKILRTAVEKKVSPEALERLVLALVDVGSREEENPSPRPRKS